jgi:hypothetical protein
MRWLQLKNRFKTSLGWRSTRLVGLFAAPAVLLQFHAATAYAEEAGMDVQACASAYEQAQVTRNDGHLVEAQEHLRVCVQDHCPDFVKSDCGQWLSDIKRDIPSVIFSPVDSSGKELLDVKVSVDGKGVTLDGRAVELDPGQHEVTFEYQGKTKTEKVAIRQGEKNRVIKLEISTDEDSDGDGVADSMDQCPAEVGAAPEGCPKVDPPLDTPAQPDKSLRLGAYVGWGVGGAGFLTFAIFGTLANSADKAAREECPTPDFCDEAREEVLISDYDSKALIANIGVGVGIAGAATGTVLFFLSMPKDDKTTAETSGVSVGVLPTNGGGSLSFRGLF